MLYLSKDSSSLSPEYQAWLTKQDTSYNSAVALAAERINDYDSEIDQSVVVGDTVIDSSRGQCGSRTVMDLSFYFVDQADKEDIDFDDNRKNKTSVAVMRKCLEVLEPAQAIVVWPSDLRRFRAYLSIFRRAYPDARISIGGSDNDAYLVCIK